MKLIKSKNLIQIIITLIVIIASQILFRLIDSTYLGWNIIVVIILLYSLILAINIYKSDRLIKEIGKSLISFTIIFFLSIFAGTLINQISIEELESSAMIFVAPIIYFPVFIMISIFLKIIYGFKKGRNKK